MNKLVKALRVAVPAAFIVLLVLYLPKIRVENSLREAVDKSPPGWFNKFHLSNIGDWMALEEYAGLLALVCAKAAPSSRAISRYIHLDHPLPEALMERIVRRDDRGEELVRSDRFPFYNLVVMELRR